ncbi:two-component system activity regulator YycH [Fodinisporobacter ferrooxydans]|uniref:Two-component system activity regulator YycH n=1 Tax=Fodinisporobacter ferrooxydans TaxID=2901836 RepID=A0ABY4CMM4_9BACL|nr:two-component system activity regulator YycH [Alicyclobacillaceae bacterium MYW30-H2]
MWERLKSWLLAALVMMSLVLTFTIWTSIPTNGPIDQPTILTTVSYGRDKTVNQLVFPDQIIAHFGANKHAVLRPQSDGYASILRELQKSSIYDIKPIQFTNEEWKRAVNGHSIEMQFSWDVPFDIVSHLFPGIKIVETKPTCRRIFITADSNFQNMRIIFMNIHNVGTSSYIAHVNMAGESFATLLHQLQSKEPNYVLYGFTMEQSYYLPERQLQLPIYTYRLESFNVDQLTNSFFVDPSLTKKINERDGSFIKTDGSRGVSFSPQLARVQFTDPVTNWKNEAVLPEKQIGQAITFANDHGGIPDYSQISMENPNYSVGPDSTYTIQEYIDGIPVEGALGSIQVRLQGNEVTEFQRSDLYLGMQMKKSFQNALSASELLDRLTKGQSISENSITQIMLVFLPIRNDKKQMQLEPVYKITQSSGGIHYVDALSGTLLDQEAKHGLE